MRYAVIQGGKVANIVEADELTLPDFEPLPEGSPVGIGWTRTADAFEPPPAPQARGCTPLELIGPGGLLTDAERANIVVQAAADPAVNLWLITMAAAERIEFDDPRTVAGFAFAVARGLLTAERVAEITA